MGEIVRLAADRLDGSEITTVPAHQVGLSEALLSENTDPRDLQGATTRKGISPFPTSDNLGSAGNAVNGVKAWTRDAGTSYVVARTVTSLHAFPGNGGSYTTIAGPGWGTSGEIFQAKALNNLLILVADGTTLASWDGTTFDSTLNGSPPSEAKYIEQFASKLFVAGDDSNPQTKYFSATNNPEDWTAADDAGSITTQDGGGDTIKGLRANNKVLLTLYRNFVDVLSGDSTFNFREDRLINKGLVSVTGHCAAGEVAFFASDDGIYMVAGTTVSDITTPRIRKSYADISDKSQITLLVKGDLLYVIDYGGTDKAFVCAYKFGVWRTWTNHGFKTGDLGIDGTLYAGADGGSNTQVYKLDFGTTDEGDSITANWRTGNFGFGWDDAIKNLRRVNVHAKPGCPTVTLRLYAEGASAASDATIAFGTAGQHDWRGINTGLRGRHLGFRMSWTGTGTILGWAIYGELSLSSGQIPVEA